MSKLKLVLFLVALVTQCEAGIARIRFGKLDCSSRVYQATLGLAPLDAVREEYVSRYIGGAHHFFELGKRFKALSTGKLRSFYPDLPYIAAVIEHAENARIGKESAFHVGIAKYWVRAVERPIKSWKVQTYLERLGLETSNALLEYEITHDDNSKSFVYSYREGERQFDERGRDRRELVNVFVYSTGPETPPAVIHTVAANPLYGFAVGESPREPGPYFNEIASILSNLEQRVNVAGSHILESEATAVSTRD